MITFKTYKNKRANMNKEFEYEGQNDELTITKYTGPSGEVIIPSEIEGKPVTTIRWYAFYDCTSLTSVVIPESVTTIGKCAFAGCTSLTAV